MYSLMATITELTTNEELLLDNPHCKVLYDRDKKLGIVIWNGSPNPQEYKAAFLTLLEWAKKGNPVERFLSDTRNQGVINPQNRKWFENEMVPQAIEEGLRRAAVITSGNVFKTYYLNIILSAVNKFNMPFKIFTTEEKAFEFLLEE